VSTIAPSTLNVTCFKIIAIGTGVLDEKETVLAELLQNAMAGKVTGARSLTLEAVDAAVVAFEVVDPVTA
jgi:hypothetical protein